MHELVHDLRSPLAAIEAAAHAVLGMGVDEPAVRRLIDLVALEARSAQVMVDHALEGSGATGTVSVAPLLATVASRHATRWSATVHVEGDALDEQVTGDGAELARAIGNLVDNAFQHGRCTSVRLQAVQRGLWLVVRVLEVRSPQGVPPARQGVSHGIGLQSVRRLLLAAGGHHQVLLDEGVRVDEVHLPLARPARSA
jgi:signal transduction histidine kinase